MAVGGYLAAPKGLRVVVDDVDTDAGEHSAVQPPLLFVGHGVVEGDCFAHEAEQERHAFLRDLDTELALADEALGIINLGQEPTLPDLEVCFLDHTVEVRIEQALLLALKHDQTPLLRLDQSEVIGLVQLELDLDVCAHLFDLLAAEVHLPSPFAAHLFLDLLRRKVWRVAVGAPGVTAEAEEVRILASFAAGVPEPHAPVAAVTRQLPLEEVIVFPATVPGDATSASDALYFVPGVVVDDGLVRAVVDDAAVHDLPDVIGVTQHPVDLRVAERAANVLQYLSAAEAAFVEQVFELRDAGLTLGIEAVRPAEVFGTVLVNHDAFHLPPINPGDRVEVPERGDAVRAAALGFLCDALLRLVAEVGRVVLGHARHDRMLELSRWGVVDILRNGDQDAPALLMASRIATSSARSRARRSSLCTTT